MDGIKQYPFNTKKQAHSGSWNKPAFIYCLCYFCHSTISFYAPCHRNLFTYEAFVSVWQSHLQQLPPEGQPIHFTPLFFFLIMYAAAAPKIASTTAIIIKSAIRILFLQSLFQLIFCIKFPVIAENNCYQNCHHNKYCNQSGYKCRSYAACGNQCTNLVYQECQGISGTKL